MKENQRERITRNLDRLTSETIIRSKFLSYFQKEKVLTEEDCQDINGENTDTAKAFRFYTLIKTRGDKAWRCLLNALKETNQDDIFCVLNMANLQKHGSGGMNPIETVGVVQIRDNLKQLHLNKLRAKWKECKDSKTVDWNFIHKNTLSELFSNCTELNNLNTFETQNILKHLNDQFKCWPVVVGIDLGTKNCCVAVYSNQKISVLHNNHSKISTPSYVTFSKNEAVNWGKPSKLGAFLKPLKTLYDSKRLIGRDASDSTFLEKLKEGYWNFNLCTTQDKILYDVGKYKILPERVSAELLRKMKKIVEEELNRPVAGAVITVPAYFTNSQRKATQRAAEMAGIDVLKILNEPTAAAIAYKKEHWRDAKLVLIFDIGGGTFDVSVVKIEGDKLKTLAINGDTFLGGEDIDQLIVNYCITEYKNQTGYDIKDRRHNNDVPRSMSLLKEQCEINKILLTGNHKVTIVVPNILNNTPGDLKIKLEREKFDTMCLPILNKMIDCVKETLRMASIEKNQIDDILLVGGSTRNRKLRQMLCDFFDGQIDLNTQINADHCVAIGAALQAALIVDPANKPLFGLEELEDVIPMSIGITCVDPSNGMPLAFSPIFKKNSSYPSREQQEFRTHRNNQRNAFIQVYQGDDPVAKKTPYSELSHWKAFHRQKQDKKLSRSAWKLI